MIYFALNERNGLVKIGHTKNKAQGRAMALQSASGDPVSLIHQMEGDERVEAALHYLFSSLREVGEWFRFERQIKDFIGPVPWGKANVPRRNLNIALAQPEYEALYLAAIQAGVSTNAMAKRLIIDHLSAQEGEV